MAQSRVTEFFSARKRSFDIIQPSKKLKLSIEFEPHTKLKTLRPSVSTSTKRITKRKQATGTAGNIKTFLDRNVISKQLKFNDEPVKSNQITAPLNFEQQSIMPGVSKRNIENRNDRIIQKSLNANSELFERKDGGSLITISGLQTNPKFNSVLTVNQASSNIPSVEPSLSVSKNTVASGKEIEKEIAEKRGRSDSKNTQSRALFMEKMNNLKEKSSKVEQLRKDRSLMVVSDPKSMTLQAAKDVIKLDTKSTQNASLKEKINKFREGTSKIQKPKTSVPEIPAYERFNSLAQNATESSLVLPFKYRFLYEAFQAVETVVSLLHNRNEVCTFDKLKASVQQLLKRNFSQEHLAQIVSVYPAAYTLQIDKEVKCFNTLKSKSTREQLTITPNISQNNSSQNPNSVQLTPSVTITRRQTFFCNLVNITKVHHEQFLLGQVPPIRVPLDQIMRWHPKFPIDTVPDIISTSLPTKTESNISTAQDVLDRVEGVAGDRIEKALKGVIQEKPFATLVSNAIPKAATIQKKATETLKSTYQTLLEKIRAKESAKVARDILRPPAVERKIEMLARLPELIRIIRTFFITEKRAAVAMEEAKMKVCDSLRSQLSPDEVEVHLNLLAKVVPKLISFVVIPKGVFLKIDKNMQLAEIDKIINAEIVKEKA